MKNIFRLKPKPRRGVVAKAESDSTDHYSYTLYADPAIARGFDERRFGGPIGDLVAATQAALLLESLAPVDHRRVIDVGTGTGRASILLAGAGAVVTGIDASEPMLAVARRRAVESGVAVEFSLGDAHALAFPDRAFDAAVCLRVLMHAPLWRTCLAELCRVADRVVIVDYPSAQSFAVFQVIARKIIHAFGAGTEPYRVLSERAIVGALAGAGFRVRRIHRQFVLPIALHKAIGSRRFTDAVERLLARIGLLRLLGSPVTIVAERA
jgi:2-polyprenyl-3-methyl-5-hydroxy-6-metoxy-1,4-benzoquinol methylase